MPTYLFLQVYIVDDVKPMEDSVPEGMCIKCDLARGAGSIQGQEKHLCWSSSCADSGDEVANKTTLRCIKPLEILNLIYLLQSSVFMQFSTSRALPVPSISL